MHSIAAQNRLLLHCSILKSVLRTLINRTLISQKTQIRFKQRNTVVTLRGGGASERVMLIQRKAKNNLLGFAAKFDGRRCSLDVIGLRGDPMC